MWWYALRSVLYIITALLYKQRNYCLADLPEGLPRVVDLDALLDGAEALVERVLELHLYGS